MYCKYLLSKFFVKVFLSNNYILTKQWFLIFFFTNNFLKKQFCHKNFTHFLNLVYCVCLFICSSVSQVLCKYPALGGQTKFWSKVLAPVLASDDTILEMFKFNDLNFLLRIFGSIKISVTSKKLIFLKTFCMSMILSVRA